jgi:hypothetical protein
MLGVSTWVDKLLTTFAGRIVTGVGAGRDVIIAALRARPTGLRAAAPRACPAPS